MAVPFDGGYRAWRAAIADGWTVAGVAEQEARRLTGTRPRPAARPVSSPAEREATNGRAPGEVARPARRRAVTRLSKDAYRRQKTVLEAELTRLGLRKTHLELSIGDPSVAANFVELRRVTSELADVEVALATAEDAWLELEERAP
jgi:hypothetical protein